ncbi:MAG: 4-alpha-glucanotransferase [Spirochaetales bacterium]|nr:4-alpha-glucanotransferase [Spirochaetales bacterium]
MELNRMSGILAHPTSFPGDNGSGELGKWAFHFIDFLHDTGQRLWQILPLGPTGYGDSPYACFSAFAGNPLMISLDELVSDGFLRSSDLTDRPEFDAGVIDFGRLIKWKTPLLNKAATGFAKRAGQALLAEYGQFCKSAAYWLDDYCLFMSIKSVHDEKAAQEGKGSIWYDYWDSALAGRDKAALDRWRKQYSPIIEMQKILQFFFFRQWTAVRRYANSRDILIIGDLPIFVAPDSADIWANRELFYVDDTGRPTLVSGVPPDYFSIDGQLWGNPLYNWKNLEKTSYSWWIERLEWMLELVDVIRIDHFRGLEAYWEVKAGALTARKGRWVKAGGNKLFAAVKKALGQLPIIVEDLGVITDKVNALREKWEFPGMAVLQFAFGLDEDGRFMADHIFCPHMHIPHQVVYTGSHDNDTIRGWYASLPEKLKDTIRCYMGRPDNDIVWEIIRMALSSVARWAIVPLQDYMELGSEARMNKPSTMGGNWTWRYRTEQISDYLKGRLKEMTRYYNR